MDALVNTTPNGGGKPVRMSTKAIAEVTEKLHKNVLRDVREMLLGLYDVEDRTFEQFIQDGSDLSHDGFDVIKDGRGYIAEVLLDREHTMTLITGYDVKLRKRVVDKLAEYEAGQTRLPTTAEAFANVFQMVADQERRHAERDQVIRAIDARIERIEDTAPLKVKPQNTETLSEIRERINRKHGLPVRIINEVMGELPYSPRAFAMVKNSHENAKGSSFAVWRIIDVTKLFARFVGECIPATATTATHNDIQGRFKLPGKAGA